MIETGLLALYRFEGDLEDHLQNKYPISGATTPVFDTGNKGLKFDGVTNFNYRVNIASPILPCYNNVTAGLFGITFWITVDDSIPEAAQWRPFSCRNTGSSFEADQILFYLTRGSTASKFNLGFYKLDGTPASVTLATDLDVGTDYFVALWMKPASPYFFYANVTAAGTTCSGANQIGEVIYGVVSDTFNLSYINVGQYNSTSTQFFGKFTINELRLYNRSFGASPSADVISIYNDGLNYIYPKLPMIGLVNYYIWEFNEWSLKKVPGTTNAKFKFSWNGVTLEYEFDVETRYRILLNCKDDVFEIRIKKQNQVGDQTIHSVSSEEYKVMANRTDIINLASSGV